MKPITVYRVSSTIANDHFPTLAEARMWFEDIRQDSACDAAELQELLIIPPSREGICTYLNGAGYLLESKTLDRWVRPDDPETNGTDSLQEGQVGGSAELRWNGEELL